MMGLLTVSAVLSGCVTTPDPSATRPVEPTEFEKSLIDSAKAVQYSVRMLAETRNAEVQMNMTPEQQAQAYRNAREVPPGLEKPISLDWDGPVQPAIEVVAKLTRYDFKVFGKKVGPAPMVRLRSDTRPAVDVLRDLGSAIGAVAEVRVIPAEPGHRGVIELDYRSGGR